MATGPRGANLRFVVISSGRHRIRPRSLHAKLYYAGGDMENRISEQQLDPFTDRTSAAVTWVDQ